MYSDEDEADASEAFSEEHTGRLQALFTDACFPVTRPRGGSSAGAQTLVAQEQRNACAAVLLAAGASPSEPLEVSPEPPLHWAARHNNGGLVRELIRAGAPLEHVTALLFGEHRVRRGRTDIGGDGTGGSGRLSYNPVNALGWAAYHARPEAVRVLLHEGAHPLGMPTDTV